MASQANHFTKERQKRSRFVCWCPLRFHPVGDVLCRTKPDDPRLQQKAKYGYDFQRSTLLSNWKAVFLKSKNDRFHLIVCARWSCRHRINMPRSQLPTILWSSPNRFRFPNKTYTIGFSFNLSVIPSWRCRGCETGPNITFLKSEIDEAESQREKRKALTSCLVKTNRVEMEVQHQSGDSIWRPQLVYFRRWFPTSAFVLREMT